MSIGMDKITHPAVAIIGAGPAGLFAARELANQGCYVVLFNRDIKPGGLAEYGIYPEKYRMKAGLRKQFRMILDQENIDYYGNLVIGRSGDLRLDDLRRMGFQAILTTAGAQGTKWLGLPGEDLAGVYHAKDIVYHYNRLPPFSQHEYPIGKRVAIIGVGNVMMDIARYLITELHVDEITALARRGPGEIKFDRGEIMEIIANLDLPAFKAEVDGNEKLMLELGQDPDEIRRFVVSVLPKAKPTGSDTHFCIRFLLSPKRMLGDENGCVCGLEVEHNTLVAENGRIHARSLGTTEVLDVDTVIFAIGDVVDENIGLPVSEHLFCKDASPRFPIDGISYEVFDPETCQPIPDLFVAGWSREASRGLVGVARRDGTNAATAILQYMEGLPAVDLEKTRTALDGRLSALPKSVIDKADLDRLADIERQEAERLGVEEFKYASNEEMLAVLEKAKG
jgi:ferredoxin--NADP+ reductase